jgi:hypothetical protein
VSPQTSRLRSKPQTILAVFAEPSLAHETAHERSWAVEGVTQSSRSPSGPDSTRQTREERMKLYYHNEEGWS